LDQGGGGGVRRQQAQRGAAARAVKVTMAAKIAMTLMVMVAVA
jgi:hypothetical protein